jgi:hypothetical protein
MAALTTQTITDAAAALTFTTLASASDTAHVGNGRDTFLVCRNTSASPVTVTITPPGETAYGEDLPAKVVTVPATSGERWIPLRKEYAGDDNRATIATATPAAGVTVAVVRMA